MFRRPYLCGILSAMVVTSSIAVTPASAATRALPKPKHVVVVIEENHSQQEIIGSSAAPYMNSLAKQGAMFTNSHGDGHPSQPNYYELFSGSTQGITDDTPPSRSFNTPNLGSELWSNHLSFYSYMDSMPSVGFTGDQSGAYVEKHNPAITFSNVSKSCIRPFTQFPSHHFNQLPTVSFVVPDLNHDMHDGTISQADTWLKDNLSGYVKWAKKHNSLLIVTWDEDDYASNNQIPTFMVGPMVKPGIYSQHIDHFNVLRTIEAMYGLKPFGNSKDRAPITSCLT